MAIGKGSERHGSNLGAEACSRPRWRSWVVPVAGLVALLWFVLRVVPRPSRAAYPCQRVAAPLAAGFVAWLCGLAASVTLLRRARLLAWRSRWLAAGLAALGVVAALLLSPGTPVESAGRGVFTPSDPPNSPMGTARGIFPGRVVWVWEPDATSWDGLTGIWSDHVDQAAVTRMCSEVIRSLGGADDDVAAWDALFRHFNQTHGHGNLGYQPGQRIAIKVNMVAIGDDVGHFASPGNRPYNSPQLVLALLRQLVDRAGVAPGDITVYDASQLIPGTIYDLCSAGDLAAVRFVDRTGGDGRELPVHDPAVAIHHADPGVPMRWLPQSVTQADYVVNLAHLKGHYYAGVTLTAKNHFGSTWVESGARFWPGEAIHPYINAYEWTAGPTWLNGPARPMGTYNPLVELMGHRDLGEKTVLFMVDGLYAPVHQSASMEVSPPWQSAPFDGDWTSSVFASQDEVAVDSVCLDFLRSEPTQTYLADDGNHSTVDDYLHEAARADNPPSGTFYDPEGDGTRLISLGAHEHWDNAADKRYTRNLGTGSGIELFSVHVFRDGFESGDTTAW